MVLKPSNTVKIENFDAVGNVNFIGPEHFMFDGSKSKLRNAAHFYHKNEIFEDLPALCLGHAKIENLQLKNHVFQT